MHYKRVKKVYKRCLIYYFSLNIFTLITYKDGITIKWRLIKKDELVK